MAKNTRPLGDNWESEYRNNRDGGQTFVTRRAGQTTNYPHDTSYVDKNGQVHGLHHSPSKKGAPQEGIKNPGFWLQDDVYNDITSDGGSDNSGK